MYIYVYIFNDNNNNNNNNGLGSSNFLTKLCSYNPNSKRCLLGLNKKGGKGEI